MAEGFTNFANTNLSSSIISSDTSIAVSDGSAFPTADFYIVIDGANPSTHEIIHVASRSSNTLTADVRGADGTTATSHGAGARVVHGWLARHAIQPSTPGQLMAMGY